MKPKRFIPAHAENTVPKYVSPIWYPVHPRARGEHDSVLVNGNLHAGSSPRTRRTLFFGSVDVPANRFIPAHAENTDLKQFGHIPLSVHPRARGEHFVGAQTAPTAHGSSPRTRRTPALVIFICGVGRFIPAHAENTLSPGAAAARAAVHPRARGEHPLAFDVALAESGSSPRTRRTRAWIRLFPMEARFIPAHAENTRASATRRPTRPVHPRARGEHRAVSELE